MTPATIKMLVIMYVNTITVLMQAIRSASLEVRPDFSPSALAQRRQALRIFKRRLCKILSGFLEFPTNRCGVLLLLVSSFLLRLILPSMRLNSR